MDTHGLSGLSVVEPNSQLQMIEAQLTNAVIATGVDQSTADPTIRDVRAAIQQQFAAEAIPIAITRFCSDFVIQFATLYEKELVASSRLLHGDGFSLPLLPWSNTYGARVIKWETEVAIDITGFPSHAFDPSALGPLLSHHCNIQAYIFNKSKGACRVCAFALNTESVPKTGNITLQYPEIHGVCNVVFPVTMNTYPYCEAPEFKDDSPTDLTNSTTSIDTAELFGVDRKMLEEAYEWQHTATMELNHQRCNGHASNSDSSLHGLSSQETPFLFGDSSSLHSFESDRSWKLR